MKAGLGWLAACALLMASCADAADETGAGQPIGTAAAQPTSARTATPTASLTSSPAATPSLEATPAASTTLTTPAPATISQPSPAPQQTSGATATTAPPRASSASVTVRAKDLAFNTATIRVPAGARISATMVNDDTGIEHNLTFGAPGLPHGDTCAGPCTRTQTFTAPASAGSFFFLCTIHDMFGTFVVE